MIDTHCHLDSEVFFQDLEAVLQKSRERGVTSFIIPGADLKDLKRAQEIAQIHEDVYFAAGVHPYHLEDFSLSAIQKGAEEKKCVAIGECGLDYFRLEGEEDKIKQEKVFREQIELALELSLPLILHVREASVDTANILRDYPQAYGVFHCFNADEILLEFQERFYYGIGGVLTFKNAKRLPEVLPKIPLERLLLETDAPYLTPHPHRGERNDPSYIPLVLERISGLLGICKDEISYQCDENSRRLFKI